mgnify:FL=1
MLYVVRHNLCVMPVDAGANPEPTVIVRMGEGKNSAGQWVSIVLFAIHRRDAHIA